MNAQSQQPRAVRPFWLNSALTFVWAGLTALSWQYGQHGDTGGILFSVLFAFLFLAQLNQTMEDLTTRRFRRKIMDDANRNRQEHGKARFANEQDIKWAGMTHRDGLFLGKFGKHKIYYPGETHLLSIAPPGAGKGTSIVVPNLLTSQMSMIVTDPKGELWAMTHRARRKMGQRIIVLCPWAADMSKALGIDIPDHGFNPYSILSEGHNRKDEAELLSSLFLPGKAQMGASDEFWLDGGQSVITAFSLFLSEKYERIDLPLLRKYLLSSPEILFDTLDEMSGCLALNGAIAEYGGKLLGTLKNSPQQFEGALGTAQKALRIYDSGSPLGQHVAAGEIDFKSLKDTPTTVYLIMPSDRAGTHAAWLNMVISLAIELVGRDRSSRRVLFMLDEFANLGYLPNVLRGMAQYRGQGVQVWSIIQQISQMTRLYQESGMREIIGMSEMINTFGVWEPQTLKMISEWMGNQTIRNFGQNITPQQQGGQFGYQFNASDQAMPLMRPEEIRTMPSEDQLIFYRNVAPIRAQKVPYFRENSFRTKADPNPYLRYK